MFERGCDFSIVILATGRRIQEYECVYLEGGCTPEKVMKLCVEAPGMMLPIRELWYSQYALFSA